MRKVFLCLLCFCGLFGNMQREIKKINIPNVFFVPNELKLEMIFNSKAKIGGKWYRVNDNIFNFVIKNINMQNVILEDSMKRELILKIRD